MIRTQPAFIQCHKFDGRCKLYQLDVSLLLSCIKPLGLIKLHSLRLRKSNLKQRTLNGSERCIPIKLFGTKFDNSNNLLELYLHAYKMNPDSNPNLNSNSDNPNNLLETIISLGHKVRIECYIFRFAASKVKNLQQTCYHHAGANDVNKQDLPQAWHVFWLSRTLTKMK